MKKILLLSFLFSFSNLTAQETADNVCNNPNPNAGISPSSITVTTNDGNGPCNMMDNDLTTRWSAEGIGQEAIFDLGTAQDINTIEIAFFKGNQRTTSFDLSVSTDGNRYTKVLENVSSSGNSLQLEKFKFTNRYALYLKYTGLGNSEPNNVWNSITELQIGYDTQALICPTSQVVLTSQQQIDDFRNTYNLSCTFQGGIKIEGADIANLNGLAGIGTTYGILEIVNNPILTDISGLSILSGAIGLQIYDNPSLENLDGLSRLAYVGNILVSRNNALSDVSGLAGLIDVREVLNISRNPSLSDCAVAAICSTDIVKGETQIYKNTGNCLDLATAEVACSGEPEEPEPGICTTDQVVLTTQQQVDDFSITYDVTNCTFQGGMKIQGADITNLNGLSGLKQLDGSLEVSDNPILTDISGLSELSFVIVLQIFSNASLENLNALSELTSVGANVLISRNTSLTDISGLSGLTNVGGSLNISRNPELSNCAITLICDATVVGGDTQIYKNTGNCADLTVAEAACSDGPEEPEPGTCPTSQLVLTTQQEVDNFSSTYDAANCTFDQGIKISGSDITNFNGLSRLVIVKGGLEISNNPSLTDMSGLSGLTSTAGLQIYSNASLESLNGLSGLTWVGGNMLISRNSALVDVSDLSELTYLGANLNISRNPVLSNCAIALICDASIVPGTPEIYKNTGNCADLTTAEAACSGGPEEPEPLKCPTSVVILNTQQEVDNFATTYDVTNCTFDQGISISDTDITNLNGLAGLVTVNGSLYITINPLLEDISGLSSLRTVNFLIISSNPLLVDMSGLSSLSAVDRNLQISSNASLENFDGLSSLKSVGVNMLIRNNDALSNLNGLSELNSVGGSLNISRNGVLSNCAIALVCDTTVVSGDSNIYQNTGDCEDLAAAEASCSGESQSRPFITTWKTDNNSYFVPNNDVTIGTSNNFNYDFDIDWGDGSFDSGVTSTIVHTYAIPGTYQVVITGVYPFINFNRSAKLISVDQWGTNQWQDLYTAFEGCENMDVVAQDVPDLSKVASLNYMFADCKNLKGNEKFNEWDVSGITSMKKMFLKATSFNQDLGDWNVSNVVDMSYMFNKNVDFNQPIGLWNVSNVQFMQGMLSGATSFNQDISSWNVAKVQSMFAMFAGAEALNQTLEDWNIGNVTDMSYMLNGAIAFSQENYDKTLIGWSTQQLQNGVTFIGDSQYCLGEEARQKIIDNFGWTITDSGKAEDCEAGLSGKTAIVSNKSVLSPNPATMSTTLRFESLIQMKTIHVYDIFGRLVTSYEGSELNGDDTYVLNVSFLPVGNYFIKSQDVEGNQYQKQMVIMK